MLKLAYSFYGSFRPEINTGYSLWLNCPDINTCYVPNNSITVHYLNLSATVNEYVPCGKYGDKGGIIIQLHWKQLILILRETQFIYGHDICSTFSANNFKPRVQKTML